MSQKFKKFFYFPIAFYFFIFAKIKLYIWNPKVICITGSSGKTTLLHLLESQINDAHFSHKANSAFGIPFDILGIRRKTFSIFEWPILFLLAPFSVFKPNYNEKLYVAEVDCDRPYEGKFLSSLLNPLITLWLTSDTTHTKNFKKENFSSLKEAVAFEYGYFIEKTKDKVFVNGDLELIEKQLKRAKTTIEKVKIESLIKYEVLENGVIFKTHGDEIKIAHLLPKETFYSIMAVKKLLEYLDLPYDNKFSKLILPPGRSSKLNGIKNTTIIDSSYNSSLISLKSMLDLLDKYPKKIKWAVIGDILELGEKEKEEHEKIAEIINKLNLEMVVLVGPRTQEYTYPKINNKNAIALTEPSQALTYLKNNLKGEEVILFKGARFLEGIIEHLLLNESDIKKLCRRESIWQRRREKWGL